VKRVAYFDSSAILKLTLDEPESIALVEYLEDPIDASTSCLAEVEVVRAIRRAPVVTPDWGEALRGFFFLSIDSEVRRSAAELGGRSLGSLDAIHLASALAMRVDNLEFVTYDVRQAAVARELGLRVVQPGC
jgi:predicted nucleic acid-binding protein